jgi:radical SAM protein with 4Fe4S-binding SPASM domain
MTYERPKRAIIETEYTCNLRCEMCSLWQENYIKNRNENKNLTEEKLREIYAKLKEFGVKSVTYIGGEPFLKEYLFSTAKELKEFGISASTVTNGTVLNEEKIKEIAEKELFENIIFSLDGTQKTHDEIRGKGVFEKIYENIKTLRKIKNKNKLKKPKVLIYITVWDKNYADIEKTLRAASSLNPNKIRIQLASHISEEIIKKTDSVLKNSIETHSYLNDIQTEKAFVFIKEISFSLKEKYGNLEFEKIFEEENKKCRFINKDFIITPNGNILICPMLTQTVMGNIYLNDLSEVFEKNRKKIEEIKGKAETGMLPICYECCVEKIR